MKKILYTTLMAVSALLTVSCREFLTVVPEDRVVAENYYVDAEAVRQNTASLYASRPWFDYHSGFMFYGGDMLAGDMYYTYDQEGHYYYNSVTSTNSHLYKGWYTLFRIISFANSIILDMPEAARNNGVEEEVIQAALGEAYTMRAYAYYVLTEYWGEVPIIENSTALITSDNTNDIYVRKNTQESLYRFIERDLERAVEVLPESDDPERATKWTAMGLLAKVQVTHAAYLMGSNQGAAAELYAEAKTNAKNAVDGGQANGYGMWSDYSTMFDVQANNCCESLLAIQCCVGVYGDGNARNANFSRSSVIADQSWGGGKGPTISLQNSYAPEDLRRKAVFMTGGDYYENILSASGGYTYYFVNRGCVPGSDDDPLETAAESSNEMLANIKKYVIGKPEDCDGCVGLNQDGGNNLYLLRFTDVMMVYIEACIGTGNETGDGVAIGYMGQILNRAGLSNNYSSISYIDLIKERRKEFAFEGQNWFDIKRLWYRNHEEALNYLSDMDRDMKYTFNWRHPNFKYDGSGNPTYSLKDQYVWENQREMYTTVWESMDITADNAPDEYYNGAQWLEEHGHRVQNINFNNESMYLPIPEAEATNAPILREPAVEYEFTEEE